MLRLSGFAALWFVLVFVVLAIITAKRVGCPGCIGLYAPPERLKGGTARRGAPAGSSHHAGDDESDSSAHAPTLVPPVDAAADFHDAVTGDS